MPGRPVIRVIIYELSNNQASMIYFLFLSKRLGPYHFEVVNMLVLVLCVCPSTYICADRFRQNGMPALYPLMQCKTTSKKLLLL